MNRLGKSMTIKLGLVHLNWGKVSNSGARNRNEFEVYIPIPANEARRLNLYQGLCFNVTGEDFVLMAGGSQGSRKEYGKNFESKGNLKLLGYYLKEKLKASPGDTVTITWVNENEVSIKVNP